MKMKWKSRPALCVRTAGNAAPATEMVAAVALRGIFKRVKVAAAQRVAMSLRAQQGSLVGGHLDG